MHSLADSEAQETILASTTSVRAQVTWSVIATPIIAEANNRKRRFRRPAWHGQELPKFSTWIPNSSEIHFCNSSLPVKTTNQIILPFEKIDSKDKSKRKLTLKRNCRALRRACRSTGIRETATSRKWWR